MAALSPHEIDTICFRAIYRPIKSHTLWVDLMTTMGIGGLSDTVTKLHHDNKTTLQIRLLSFFAHDQRGITNINLIDNGSINIRNQF